jgi:hypothetical protein
MSQLEAVVRPTAQIKTGSVATVCEGDNEVDLGIQAGTLMARRTGASSNERPVVLSIEDTPETTSVQTIQ